MKRTIGYLLVSVFMIFATLNIYGCRATSSSNMKSDHIQQESNKKDTIDAGSVAEPAGSASEGAGDNAGKDTGGDSGGGDGGGGSD